MNNDFISLYLKSTMLWPQRRAAVNIYLLFGITSSYNSLKKLHQISSYQLNPDELSIMERAMMQMHTRANVNRKLGIIDIQKDWTYALGAIYRSLILYFRNEDPLNKITSDYSSLVNYDNYCLIEHNSKLDIHFWANVGPIASSAMKILEDNKDLAQLYKIGFYVPTSINRFDGIIIDEYQNIAFKYFNDPNFKMFTPNIVWEKIGRLLKDNLQIMYPTQNLDWLLRGFR